MKCKRINWGKLYDKYAACLHGIPIHFCGCRWDNVEWCYDIKERLLQQRIDTNN